MVKPKEGFGRAEMVRLWIHESLRVFGDRLVDDADRGWFLAHLNDMVRLERRGVYEDSGAPPPQLQWTIVLRVAIGP